MTGEQFPDKWAARRERIGQFILESMECLVDGMYLASGIVLDRNAPSDARRETTLEQRAQATWRDGEDIRWLQHASANEQDEFLRTWQA